MENTEHKVHPANPWMLSTLVLLGLVVGFGIAQLPFIKGMNGQDKKTAVTGGDAQVAPAPSPTPTPAAAPAPPPAAVLTQDQMTKLADDDPVMGEANAPITMVEFSDFQCPFCGRFFSETLPSIEDNYIKTGKVKLIYRDFPLEFHPLALPAAEASECANEQGKFWEMHDMLFTNQTTWVNDENPTGLLKKYAKDLKLDTKKFNACFDAKQYQSEIKKDAADGEAVGINGTPGFFINGKLISGALPYETMFKPALEAELAGKKWEVQYDAMKRPVFKLF